jgi:hypothetical protein
LTYDDSKVPAHYGWKQPARFEEIERAYQFALKGEVVNPKKDLKSLEKEVRKVIRELDSEGRWISSYAGEKLVGQPKFADGFRFISSAVFSNNFRTISEFIQKSIIKENFE